MGGRALSSRFNNQLASIAASTISLLILSPVPGLAKKPSRTSAAPTSNRQSVPPSTPLSAAPTANDNAPPFIQGFEKRLFFKTFPEEQMAARVERIEKNVFGESSNGSLQERLARLNEIYQQQEAEEQQRQQADAARAAAQQARQMQLQQARDAATNSADEMERARVSIQAAREQEIEGLLADGVNLYRQKQGGPAQDKFEQVLRLDPQNAQAHFNLGIIEESRGNYVEALASYKQAAQTEPDNQEYREAVAAIQKKATVQQKYEGKRAELRDLAENANAAWKRGEYMSALDLYNQLDQKEPNRALVKYNIGSIYLMLKDQMSAVDYYKQAAKLEPNNPKYVQAYQRLSAEVQHVQQEQDRINQEAVADYNAAHPEQSSTPQTVQQNGGKRKKHKQPKAQPVNSPYAPILGAAPPATNMPRGRSSFGVNPVMMNQFNGTTQVPGGVIANNGQNSASAMASYGLIGRANGQGGVTLTNVGLASRAAAAGLIRGDDIRAVDGIQIASPQEIEQILSRKDRSSKVPVLFMRGGNLAVVNL